MEPIPQPPPMPPVEDAVIQQPANPAPPTAPPLNKEKARQELLFTLLLFGAALLVIGLIVGFLKVWARRQTNDCESPAMSLSSYREMYENGELSEEEYQQIRDKMATKMKGSLGIKSPSPLKPKPGPDVGRNGTPPAPETEG